MYITARINGEQGPIFRLCSWSAQSFAGDPVLHLQTDDLLLVKQTFEHVTKIQIYVSQNPVAAYTKYDTYGSISYSGKVYVEHENIFADCMSVSLVRSSLVDQVEKINEKVNPVIDIESMTMEEYKEYLLKQIGVACREQIYGGTQVQLPSSGAIEKYTYNDDDQRNLTNAMAILIIAPELPSVPYHPSGGFCRMIPSLDLLTIYSTLQLQLTYLTTRCNFMRMWIKGINTKEELLTINWNTELPEEYQQQVNEIYQQSLVIIQTIKEKFMRAPVEEPDDPGTEEPQNQNEEPNTPEPEENQGQNEESNAPESEESQDQIEE